MTLRFERRHAVMLALVVGLFALSRYDGGGLPFVPVVDDAPIDVDSLHVLVLYESGEKHRMTPGQVDVIEDLTHAGALRRWLSTVGTHRTYDDDVDDQYADQWVKDALSKHDETVPWLLIANRSSGYVGPLPDGVEATRALIEEYVE